LPAHVVGELIDGELFVSPRPATRHALASSALGALLGYRFQFGLDGPGGWWIIDEVELHLGEDVLVPDVAGFRKTRLPEYPDSAAMTLAPDWACEVLSPSTAKLDRGKKLAAYEREGVSCLWLIDPRAKVLEIYDLVDGRLAKVVEHRGDGPVRAQPFEAIELPMGLLWGGTAAK
jgi:Uma2 family endonuclease